MHLSRNPPSVTAVKHTSTTSISTRQVHLRLCISMDKLYITLIQRGGKKGEKVLPSLRELVKVQKKNRWLGCLCLYTLYLPAPILIWPGGARVCPSGSSHHCGCCRCTGTHPNPTTSRGAELPSLAPFLPKPQALCLAALLVEEEAQPASRGYLC